MTYDPPVPSLLSPLADLMGGEFTQPVWGIDPATTRFSVGVVRPEDGAMVADGFDRGEGWAVATRFLPRDDMGPRRWRTIEDVLREFFSTLAAATGEPTFILIETPFSRPSPGRNSVHPESFYAVGVGCAALASVFACPIDYVGPSEWKRPALGEGRGNAKKPEILFWAREELGYHGECGRCGNIPDDVLRTTCDRPTPAHDEADAVAIAVAAARRLATYGVVVE